MSDRKSCRDCSTLVQSLLFAAPQHNVTHLYIHRLAESQNASTQQQPQPAKVDTRKKYTKNYTQFQFWLAAQHARTVNIYPKSWRALNFFARCFLYESISPFQM